MLNEEKVDLILKQALSPVTPDEKINQKLKQELEGRKMKKYNAKKVIIGVAACCMLLGTVGIASSGVVGYVVSSTPAHGDTDFSNLEEVEKEVGYSIKALESFQNGYSFAEMVINNNTEYDESDNALGHYKDISLEYSKNGEDRLLINAMDAIYAAKDVREPDAVTIIEDIEVKYYLETYKWVPDGYELTEADKINMERDDYFISDGGADPVSENFVSHVVWEQDGICYSILNIYDKTDANVLFQMAEELITTE